MVEDGDEMCLEGGEAAVGAFGEGGEEGEGAGLGRHEDGRLS